MFVTGVFHIFVVVSWSRLSRNSRGIGSDSGPVQRAIWWFSCV